MSAFTFFSLCLVILVSHWNQVRCESELSTDEGEVRLRREDALELYHILKRQLNTSGLTSLTPSLKLNNNGLSSANLGFSRQFGQNDGHSLLSNVGWDKQNGFHAGAGAKFNWNDGRTSLTPKINFNRNGYESSSLDFSHNFGKDNQNSFGVSVGHNPVTGWNAGIGGTIRFKRQTN